MVRKAEGMKSNPKMLDTIQFRTAPQTKSKIKALAETYAGGNMSMWLEWAALNAPRQHLVFQNIRPLKARRP